MRVCLRCNEAKTPEEFSSRGTSLDVWCKDCRALYKVENASRDAYRRTYNQENSVEVQERRKTFNSRRQQEVRAWIDELKSEPCTDCRQTFDPVCMDFDHLGDKKFTIGKVLSTGISRQALEAEIAKCELVCANCHRLRTKYRK